MSHIKRIPDKDIEFNSFLESIEPFLNFVPPGGVTNAERLGTSAETLALFNEKFALWEANWELHENQDTRTETINLEKDNLRDEIEPIVRDIQNKADTSDNVTSQDRVTLQIPERDSPSSIPAPAVAPDITIEKREHRQNTIRFHNPIDPDTNAKPHGVDSIEVVQFIGDNPPVEDEWINIGSTGRFLFKINYEAADVKKEAHIAARYRNPKGELGPWSDTITVVIS